MRRIRGPENGETAIHPNDVLTKMARRLTYPRRLGWHPVASWFETRGSAALLTMRISDLILRSIAKRCVSKD